MSYDDPDPVDVEDDEPFVLCDEDEDEDLEPREGCGLCRAEAEADRKAQAAMPVVLDADGNPYVFVVAARVVREYGGPEEGGWTVDEYRVVEIRAVQASQVDTAMAAMAEKYPNTGLRGSVLGGDDFSVYLVDDTAGAVPVREHVSGPTHYC